MEMKRKPIRRRVQLMVLLISLAALIATSSVGLISMLGIRQDSQTALISQMEQNLRNIVTSKASLADSELSRYSDYIGDFVSYIQRLYESPDAFLPHEVLPPDAKNANVYSMQRYLVSEEIAYADVAEEISLLGNLENVWKPVVEDNTDIISTIYVGTESGFHISYDPRADLGVTEGSYESYYDYFNSEWYASARSAGKTVFTDVYADAYGRGLTISCAAPFYSGDRFMGAVCMDILVTDLQREIISLDLGEGAYAFLVDRRGNIIASPYVSGDQEKFENIRASDHPISAAAIYILGGTTGVTLADNGVYYAYSPILSANWKLCVHIPEAVILAPVEAMNEEILLVILLFIAVFVLIIAAVVFIVRRFSRQLTDPLIALGKDVETISGGNLDYRARIAANDEIGDLARCFNAMTENLKHYIADLTSVTAEKERIGAELDVATHIQSSMLPCIFPAFPERPEIDVYATMTPAKEVGGDFYDFFMVDERHLAIVMADVSGKGVPAALFMVIGKTLIKDHTQPGRDLGDVFAEVNNLLCESNSEGLFITAFEGVLDLVSGEFRFVNAGHEMPFISRAGGAFEPFKIRPGFVLAGMEGMRYKSGVLELNPGDKLFQYTDGVTEATSAAEELYGMTRLQDVLSTVANRTPEEILPAVKADIDAFVGEAPQFDDITMLCLEYRKRMQA